MQASGQRAFRLSSDTSCVIFRILQRRKGELTEMARVIQLYL